MKKLFVLFVIVCLGAACAQVLDIVYEPKTQEERTDYAMLLKEPLTFAVPKDQAAEVWGRIQSFIGKYSNMKIQIATDFVVETFNPPDGWHLAYRANKAPAGEVVEITVECFDGYIIGSSRRAKMNSHVLAYYARTGELKLKFLAQ